MESRQFMGFNKEIGMLLNAKVKVLLKYKEDVYVVGVFKGFSKNAETIFLTDANDTMGNSFSKIIIKGDQWLSITLESTPFPMEGLYTRLKGVFPPGQVNFLSEANAISVMGKINVTENGVSGDGPLFERVKKIFDTYVSSLE
ncbi:MAG: Lsm family RNA-binding protein [Promethearchaeota archaeon]